MSPARGRENYTEEDDQALQDAIDKQTKRGKQEEVERSPGAVIRRGKTENA